MRSTSLRYQRGVEIVEFVLTLPMLLLLFILYVEFGLAFADKAVVMDASRAAALVVIREGDDLAKTPSTVLDDARKAANEVLQSAIIWGATTPYTCSSTTCPISYTGTDPGNQVTATVNLRFQFRFLPSGVFSRIVGNWDHFDLSGTTVMRMMPH